MATKKGIVKKTSIMEYANIRKSGLQAINLRDDDDLIEVKVTDNTKDIFLVTKHGQCIRFDENDVRTTGRVSMGVIGMNLSYDDEVVAMQLNTQGTHMLIVSEYGMGKRTDIDEFTVQHRGGKGLRCYKITDKTGYVVGVKTIKPEEEIMLITTEGIVIRMKSDSISVIGRNTSGVKLINIDSESSIKVASVAKVRFEEEEDFAEVEEDEAEPQSTEKEVTQEEI